MCVGDTISLTTVVFGYFEIMVSFFSIYFCLILGCCVVSIQHKVFPEFLLFFVGYGDFRGSLCGLQRSPIVALRSFGRPLGCPTRCRSLSNPMAALDYPVRSPAAALSLARQLTRSIELSPVRTSPSLDRRASGRSSRVSPSFDPSLDYSLGRWPSSPRS